MSDMKLYRTDFAQIGTTNRSCMRVIPSTTLDKRGSTLDKVVVGGENGVVICFSRKGSDTKMIYKTNTGPAIQSVCLGGALGTLQDKVFVSAESNVRGINRKGKQFFSFDTNMAEKARRMYIYGVDLILTGLKSYNHYHDCQDANYVLCPEEIHDVIALPGQGGAWSERPFTAVIASGDATIKVIEASNIVYDIELSDVPHTLYLFQGDGGVNNQLVLFGTKNGKLGLVDIGKDRGRVVWETPTATASAITAMTCYPFTGSPRHDVIIGKEDGMVEVYIVHEDDHVTLRSTYQMDETITSISCGRVSSEMQDEIVVCSYTGWLFSLSRTPMAEPINTPKASNVNVKVQQLKTEIEELETKVNEERARYEEMTRKGGSNSAYMPHFQARDNVIKVGPWDKKVHENFDYSSVHAAYSLSIEIVLPIDFVIIQSTLNAQLLEVQKNASVVCIIPQGPHNPWPLLASYRCQARANRIDLRIRVQEGQWGTLNVYICPTSHPKVAQLRTYDVKPLSSHVRCHQIDISRPLNVLTFSGQFSLAEAHSWIVLLVPGVPVKCPSTDTVTMNFETNVGGGTQLQAIYSKGNAVFKSDSMSTIAIVRDRINAETSRLQMRVESNCQLNNDSLEHCLRLFDSQMQKMLAFQKKKMLVTALRELEVNNEDISFLNDEYKKLLKSHDQIFEEAERNQLEDSNLVGVYEALLVDRGRLTGRNVRGRVDGLRQMIITDYSLEHVISFFKSASEEASLR